ncbi:MAG: CDP-glycerol glycerophosphotransferase family protein [Flavobacteriaceae bacterium]
MKKKQNIAIIYLDEIHHVNHFVSVAVELSQIANVTVLTHINCQPYFFKTLALFENHKVKVEKLPTSPFRALTDKLKRRTLPRKGFWLKKNMNYILNNFDAIIFTDYYHRYVKETRGDKAFPKLIKFPHGPVGRSYSYNKDLLDFDFQLLFGNYHFEQMKTLNLLSKEYVIAGYPKIDAVKSNRNKSFFNNNKPTVLYNPHFSPPLSSWHHIGLDILEFFYNQNEFNLIFAPHINLFQTKGGFKVSSIPEKFKTAKHFLIDTGSEESVNMTYILNSDVYLGDVSSQVFEFIIKPRPCIFLNPTHENYKNDYNFRFWQCGDVINSVEYLKNCLKDYEYNFTAYKAIQQEISTNNFYFEEGSTASERAAKAIIRYLDKAKNEL